jgi:hypothetical protein
VLSAGRGEDTQQVERNVKLGRRAPLRALAEASSRHQPCERHHDRLSRGLSRRLRARAREEWCHHFEKIVINIAFDESGEKVNSRGSRRLPRTSILVDRADFPAASPATRAAKAIGLSPVDCRRSPNDVIREITDSPLPELALVPTPLPLLPRSERDQGAPTFA